METARIAGYDPAPLRALREMDLGDWCGRLHSEVMERHADQIAQLANGEDVRCGGGETVSELEARAQGGLREAQAGLDADARVLVFTHGGVVRALLLGMLGLRGRHRPLAGVSNTSITVLDATDASLRLRRYNDAAHLTHDVDAEDHVYRGEEAIEQAVLRLDLDARAREALVTPAGEAETRFARTMMRTFAV